MNFSEIPENTLIFLSWVTAIGLFISLSEATIKIKLEKRNSYRKRLELINNLYPKKVSLKYLRVCWLAEIEINHL